MGTQGRLAARRRREHRQQRWVYIAVAVVLAIVVAVPAYGYFATFVLPPRHTVVVVNDAAHTLGEVVKRVRANVTVAASYGSQSDLSVLPFEVLNGLVEEELLRQGASSLGVVATREEVDEEVRKAHYPKPPAGEVADPAALDAEFRESLRNYLNLTQFSEAEYRSILRTDLLRMRVRDKLSNQVPSVAEQVYVHWITVSDPNAISEIQGRLTSGDSFESLARIYMRGDAYADDNGEVGWVPKGAFPSLDDALFTIEHNKVSDPIVTGLGTYLVKVTNGPETREIGDKMREVLKNIALEQWLNDQRTSNKVDVNFNNTNYQYVVDKVREMIPPSTGNR